MSTHLRKGARFARLLAVGLIAAASISACDDDDPTGPNIPDDEVRVSNNTFTPGNRTVTAGSTVTFRWAAGSVLHNVTFGDGPASANLTTGTYDRTFATAGAYPYQCTIHGASMSGTITVQ